jgi:aminopeptidase YwaD
MKKIVFLLIITVTLALNAQNKIHNPEITPEEIKANIYFFASDDLKGRFTGSPEEEKAGEYIQGEFEFYGLKPLFGESWIQEFPFIEKIELTSSNELEFEINGQNEELALYEDFITAPFSGKTKLSGQVVFAGYGISAPMLNYDDYAGLDVNGKIVLVMRYNPEHDSSRSDFDRYSSFRQKAITAREKGAAGIIFVNGYAPKNDDDPLMSLHYDGAAPINDFAVLQVKRNVAEKILRSQSIDFAAIQKQIDETKKPASSVLQNVKTELETETEAIEKTGHNIGGILEGNDPVLKNEYIVIGAHYDHLGIDQLKESSMYKGKEPMIHHGADDNASGSSGLLEVAEKFGEIKSQLKRSIIFLAFSGEELGILGSTYFTNNSPIDLKNVAAMLNMDMIGRLNEEKNLTVIGSGTSSEWHNLLNSKNSYGFKLGFNESGTGGSDHQSFTNKNIPVLFFFTGTHSDYHKPTDTADKINNEGETKVVQYVFDIASSLNLQDKRPNFVKVAEPANQQRMTKSRVTVGTVPEFGYNGKGYKISGVTEGGPAAKAGLKPGDIIIKFGKKAVANIYDFMYVIGEYKAGDKADVVVQRDGNEITLNVELMAK